MGEIWGWRIGEKRKGGWENEKDAGGSLLTPCSADSGYGAADG